MELVIITGMSGAGKTTALHVLEDIGYYCTDNIPPVLLPELAVALQSAKTNQHDRVAMVADMRMGQFFSGIYTALEKMKALGFECRLLYLDASDESIISRYNLTKRKHPMAGIGGGSLLSAVKKEREALEELRAIADIVIDTTALNDKSIKEKIRKYFSDAPDDGGMVRIVTFGFKRGMPMDLDMMFDMRFLPNPYYDESLKELNGLDPRIRDYVFQSERSRRQVSEIAEFIKDILSDYIANSKESLTIGVGCTGGKHRSVSSGELIADILRSKRINISVEHRDIGL